MALGRRTFAAAALAALGCSSGGSPAPVPPPTLQVYGRDIGAGWANVEVIRAGAPVADARVVVNGAMLEPSAREPGLYSGQLPVALAPGDAVSLAVTSGVGPPDAVLTVNGTGSLPDPPFILAAYTSAAVASDGDIVVTWTSPTDPDYFEAYASCWLGGWSFTAPGSARLLTIPKGALPHGESIWVSVFAYDDGAMEGDYTPFSPYPGMNIRAESSQIAVVTGADGQPPPKIEVRGQDIGEAVANVVVTQNGQPIDDAEVTANGVLLPLTAGRDGWYAGLFGRVWQGDPITLDVTWRGLHVAGAGHLPEAPFLTSPTNGAGLAPDQDVVVTWTSASDPGSFEVVVDWPCGPSCMAGTTYAAEGSARRLAVPHAGLPSGTLQLRVFAYDDGTFTGDYAPYAPYPGMNIRAESGAVTVSR